VGRKFCIECGVALATVCPNCGTPNPPAAKFCGECATPLVSRSGAASTSGAVVPGTAIAPGPSAAERRLVSVLFADLVGFTPFAEERDAEDVRETLGRYFELATDVIARYGGTVEKFIGDAVMAIWGAPIAREDDAERAVRAALELVEAVRRLGPGIEARAGVLTGEAAVSTGVVNQGMVAGDLVNTASRLQSVAAAGTVLVGETTQRAASGAIAFEPAGDQVLKGKSSPVPAWRAVRVVANRGGQGRSDLPEPPFVGRDEELRVLKDLLTAESRDPRVRVASVTGPGGIGKSRLAWELEKYVDGLVEDVYWHRGRSPSYGEGITFWALGEMVRQRAGLAESDDEETTRARLAATVVEYVPSDDDRRWVEPALLALLGIEAAPTGGRDVLFAAWRIFFERIAARGTTVLLFEDLQWADTGLLDFIDHLVEWARAAPILIVTLARPELFDRRPTWGAGTRHFTSLALEPLPETAMRQLMDGFVPGLPQAATDAILARADGIPLYAVETVRALVADGRLVQLDGAYAPVGDLETLAIPETLQSLIGSRLDALSPADRSLVQDAAVLGQAFSPSALAAVSGASDADLDQRLRGLVRREIFEVRADPRSPERGQYAFVQSLIREVAYSTLARRERRSRHHAVARHFEGLGDDELAGALATHYLAAYRSSAEGPEAEAVAAQARLALKGAASRAADLGAHQQAVSFLEQALDVTTDGAERATMLELAARSALATVSFDLAVDLAKRAVEEQTASNLASGRARALALLGSVYVEQGQLIEARAALESALEQGLPDTDDALRARILVDLSRAAKRMGDTSDAIELADRALAIAERLELMDVLADGFNNKGASLSYVGRPREAVALMEAAVQSAIGGGFLLAELRARNNLASVSWELSPKRSLALMIEAHERAEHVGHRGNADWTLGQVGYGLYFAARDWDAVLQMAAERIGAGTGDAAETQIVGSTGLILVARGEPSDDVLARAEHLSGLLSDPNAIAFVHYMRADRALLAGELQVSYDETLAAAQFAIQRTSFLALALRPALWMAKLDLVRHVMHQFDLQPDSLTPVNAAYRTEGQAGIAALEGRRSDAVAAYHAAISRFRELDYEFEAARAALDAVILLGPDEPRLQQDLADARAVFVRVGAAPYLDRLDAASARQPSSVRRGSPERSTTAATRAE
jgi:class 3 adenylate cyclase/tetratricopeptide (TPR) repeat protein